MWRETIRDLRLDSLATMAGQSHLMCPFDAVKPSKSCGEDESSLHFLPTLEALRCHSPASIAPLPLLPFAGISVRLSSHMAFSQCQRFRMRKIRLFILKDEYGPKGI